MVTYIKSDLEFILQQIKIAEAHAAGQPLFGPGGLIPAYNLSWGLRTVDGSYNHLLNPQWGSSDEQFPENLGTDFRTLFIDADPRPDVVNIQPMSYTPGVDNDGPTMTVPGPGGAPMVIGDRAGPGDVIDPTVRTISNLIVDQTLGNPAAILTALVRAGVEDPGMTITTEISNAYAPLRPLFDTLSSAERDYANASAAAAASPNNAALQQAAVQAQAAVDAAKATLEGSAGYEALTTLLDDHGIALEGINLVITNAAPDEGLSAPFNSWFTLFGQFFDHGLDLVGKGGSGTVMIPLMPDDPLYVPGSPTNFMVLTRATVGPGPDGILVDNPNTAVNEAADNIRPMNTTTAFVDQNQTYTSHPSHQVFLREYVMNAAGDPVSTGELIHGTQGGMATWKDLKAQAADLLGIQLLDKDVGNVPLLLTDPYGEFIRGANGFPQFMTTTGLVEANPNDNGGLGTLVPANALLTGHAFLADIAHTAVPEGLADGDIEIGLGNGDGTATDDTYDNELLDAHYIAGDGRANENIGLTAVHHVFHSEHNRLADHTKVTVLQTKDLAFINEWLLVDLTQAQVDNLPATLPTDAAALDTLLNGFTWDGERIFQAAKFGTEMQYQHLVFEEFARKIQPNINVFLVPDGYDVTIDPSIVAEFAHVVYRFGHSMLTETIDRLDPNFNPDNIGLIEGFLNPIQFENNGGTAGVDHDISAGAIIRGMTRQVGNEIDEFVTTALRNNLLGLPLDLATINLARGRDTGVPSLNETRAQFYEATNQDSLLKPYESWVDFAGHLKHEASIINFIAAYGTHSLITNATTIAEKRDAALTIITGISVGGKEVPADRLAFLNGSDAYAGGTQAAGKLGGLNDVDLWIGGLAEEIMPFGGMLGSTFNFVFEIQMEKLQSGDRFYYLQRLDGLHLFGEMENNSFAAMIERNTNASHLPSDVFSTPGLILEVDKTKQYNPGIDDAGLDGILLDNPGTSVDESADNLANNGDPVGGGLLTQLVVRNNPATLGTDTNYLRYTGGDHVILGGTDPGNAFNPSGKDILIAGAGDDTLYGDGGNDRLEGGFGNDIINAGDGDDIIVDSGGDDNIKAGKGHDVVHAGPGLDLVMGNDGQDFIFLGTDMGSEVFAGTGNDFIYGNKNAERILGNEGDDWIETGTFDGAPGDNFDEIFSRDGIDGNDVFLGDGGFDEFIGEGGDDIFVGSAGRGKMVGMSGFDWATYKDNPQVNGLGVNADLSIPIVFDEAPTLPQNASLDEYESVEGLSGTKFNDVLKGSNTLAEERLPTAQGGSEGYLGSYLDAQGIALINGLQQVLGTSVSFYNAGDIILGGDGSDLIQGNAGDDIIDGDKWLNVRIGIMSGFDANGPVGTEVAGNPNIKSMTSLVTLRLDASGNMVTGPTGGTPTTKTLAAWMFDGKINPGQLQIIREITTAGADAVADIDTAQFRGNRSEYAFSATADGQVVVSHAIEDQIDGTDRLRNIEKVQFLDGNALNIIVGTPNNDVLTGTSQDDLMLGLVGADTLNGGAGNDILVGGPGGFITTTSTSTYADNFNSSSFGTSTGATNWGPDWVESNDSGGVTAGQIRIDDGNNVLRFYGGAGQNGAEITRDVNLSAATTATITYDYDADNLDGSEQVRVLFAANGVDFVLLNTIDANDSGSGNHVVNGPFSATARIRFEVSSVSATDENVEVDNLVINFTTATVTPAGDTLNGGLGDDTYSFNIGDGSDVINEGVSATSGGTADRISILAPNAVDAAGQPIIDPATGLAVPTITALNAFDSNTGTQAGDLVINYSLPTGATTSVAQQITVAGHFAGTTTGTGVERINFNGATYQGYLLGADDYLISRLDPNNRDAGDVNLSASNVNNFVVGEQGVNDIITGGSANDLIFGGTGNNDLVGGLGDDLLVGETGSDDLDSRLNAAGDDFEDALGADTMVGGAGDDTYGVDDLLDVVVESANQGTDTVQTFMAALSLENMANVENLTYMGIDADQFLGTGNVLNNVITGGQLADTLSGLGGNDTLQGGLGADTMTGGDGSDVYEVDEAGDVVVETSTLTTDIDRVESDISYVLGANVENLDLNGADADINGTGNALNNIINGNDGVNQLFGGGGNDTLNGFDGNDLIDGGAGDDTINGGNDSDNIIGGAGNDTINVGSGNDTIRYTASGFGADIITNFDATGGTATTQDRIDLSALGITAANLATRVIESTSGGNTILTVRDANLATIGTIQINGISNANIDASDYILAAPPPAAFGAPTNAANTITGNAAANAINGLGGNDTLSGAGGNDVINGGEGTDTLNGGDGDDTLSGGTGSDNGAYRDEFSSQTYVGSNGTLTFSAGWTEGSVNVGGSETGGATGGDIDINGNRLRFNQNVDGGEFIERAVNLAGATSAVVSFNYEDDNLGAGQSVIVQARNVTTGAWQTLTGGTLGSTTGNGNGTFTATLSAAQIGANSAIRFLTAGDGNNWDNGDNFYVDNFNISVTAPGLNAGVDVINGDAGDDTIVWNANVSGATDGRDLINGGTEAANGPGDTFVINGNATAEQYRIYTRAAFAAVAGNTLTGIAAATEIIVTRNGTSNAAIIAELAEIEEIRINGVDPAANGTAGADSFEVIGDFSTTSLRLNTITIDGDTGDDTIDISALHSAHRIVFRSNGGNDTILGALRPEDVIELPNGASLSDYTSATVNGVTTLTNGNHSITYTAAGTGPQVGSDVDATESSNSTPVAPAATVTPEDVSTPKVGTAEADVLIGTAGNDDIVGHAGDDVIMGAGEVDNILGGDGADFINAGDGSDIVFGEAGDDTIFGGTGADLLYGNAGNDRIFGDAGDDMLAGGAGDDLVSGGAGNDLFVAESGDGNDVYFGDEASGGTGVDTLNMSAIASPIAVDLGGSGSAGYASSATSGNDTLWDIENVTTGSGADTITASNAANVLNGGAGNDTFKFASAAAANGDTIVGFQTGDRIDLSGIDANSGTAGNQAFTLVTGALQTGAGKLVVSHETRADGDHTVIEGHVDGNDVADFRIDLTGSHNLTSSDFNL